MKCAFGMYSVRYEAERDLEATIEHIASLELEGVELIGTYGYTPARLQRSLANAGLETCAYHVTLEELEIDGEAAYQATSTFDCKRLVVSWLPPTRDPSVMDGYVRRLGQAGHLADEAGFQLGFHNHAEELMLALDETTLVDRLLADAPSVFLELDLGWAWIAGCDPAEVVRRAGQKAPLLHVKDFASRDDPESYTSVGEGAVPFLPALKDSSAEWLIAEQDDHFQPDELSAASRSAAALLRLRSEVVRGKPMDPA
jgi:sugar phosphate isomerase/epimerase